MAAVVLIITLLCRAIIVNGFGVTLEPQFWYRDYLGNLVVALIAALLTQSLRKSLILSGVIIVIFQLCNAAKVSVLGTPASPDDFFNIQNIFFLTDGWRRIALFAFVSTPFVLAVVLIPWRRISVYATLACLVGTGFVINHYSEPLRIALDENFGNSVWNQPANYRQRGLALHLAQETVRTISKVETPPDRETVDIAMAALTGDHASQASGTAASETQVDAGAAKSSSKPSRNVHVFVLESFFDPTALGDDWVPEDPLPEDFRALWAETGNSRAMSPVFGGYTANAEFEVLCGFPVTRNAVFFEGWLRKAAPCLPRVLSEAGYHTLTSHPNVPGFWNRTNAYQLVGFDEYRSKDDFDMTDSIDTLLLDHSLYKQVFAYLETRDANVNSGGDTDSDSSSNSATDADDNSGSESRQPVFNYMLTYHGHLPYPGSPDYPDKVKPGKEGVLLNGYLNQIWYKSRDLMERLEILSKEDPDSLIVIFGDHLPYLGPNYGVYTEAWGLPDDRSEFNGEQLTRLSSTPLIVIDGERGPLPLGDVPLYRLPALIISLLGMDENVLFSATENLDRQKIRPVYGMHVTSDDTHSVACTDANLDQSPCDSSTQWLQQVKVLISDIFTGEQYSLKPGK